MGLALLVAASMVLFSMVVWFNAASLDRTERERERAVVALEQSEHRLFQYLENLPMGVFVVDTAGTPYYANALAKELLGKGIEPNADREVLSEVYQAYVAGSDRLYPTAELPIVRALAGETRMATDTEIRTPDRAI